MYITKTAADCVIVIPKKLFPNTLLTRIFWSYSDTPTGGALTVSYDGQTVMSVDITAAGPGFLEFKLPGTSDITITLASGAGAVVGKLTVQEY